MTLLAGFWQQCKERPRAIALSECERLLTYEELARQMGGVAQALKRYDIRPGDRVAIDLGRGIEATIAILGVLSVGACYVPLDTKGPSQRRETITDDAKVKAIIGNGTSPTGTGLDISSIAACDGEPQYAAPENIAAILYTSGSSGQPKGVALSHRAIRAFTDWAVNLTGITETDRIASLAPFYFDLSTFDLFATLNTGACVDFVPTELTLSPSRLASWLQHYRITGLYTVPSLLGFLSLKGNLSETPLPSLRFVLFAGEVFPTSILIKLLQHLPKTRFFNLYGPTETNVCSYWPVEPSNLQPDQPIPIGMAASGNELRCDADSGELCVRGPTLMSGYWRDGKLEKRFTTDGWYATGDRVSINRRGEYCYHGRLDRMLKCAGYRVEPAEIEAALTASADILECAVVGVPDPSTGQRPAAAVVCAPDSDIKHIRRALQKRLPAYMLPSRFKIMQGLPRLNNGKLDYRTLQNLLAP